MLYQLSYRPKNVLKILYKLSHGNKPKTAGKSVTVFPQLGMVFFNSLRMCVGLHPSMPSFRHRSLDFSNGKVEAVRVVEQKIADDFDH